MIVFKTQSKKWNCPTSWPDLTYSQYVSLLRLPNTIQHQISLFSGISVETIQSAELKNLEKIALALSFLSIAPHFDRTKVVAGYVLPENVAIQSTGQFEDLRGLLIKHPKTKAEAEFMTIEENEIISDLYLHACAIYVQKIKDGKYDYTKVDAVKEELKSASCAEVIGTGAFFLYRPANLSPSIMNRFRMFLIRTRRLIQGLPGYQKTLDFLLRSSESREK